jgi:hypothetical protein
MTTTFCPVCDQTPPRLVGARGESQVAPRAGLAEQLAPDVVAGEDPASTLALRLGAVGHQRRPDQRDAGPPENLRRVHPRELFVVDRDLRQRRAAPAVLDRPVDADPTAGVERALPLPQRVGLFRRRRDVDRGRLVRREPTAQLGAEPLVVVRHLSQPV